MIHLIGRGYGVETYDTGDNVLYEDYILPKLNMSVMNLYFFTDLR